MLMMGMRPASMERDCSHAVSYEARLSLKGRPSAALLLTGASGAAFAQDRAPAPVATPLVWHGEGNASLDTKVDWRGKPLELAVGSPTTTTGAATTGAMTAANGAGVVGAGATNGAMNAGANIAAGATTAVGVGAGSDPALIR